jgi:hypothetical protein
MKNLRNPRKAPKTPQDNLKPPGKPMKIPGNPKGNPPEFLWKT